METIIGEWNTIIRLKDNLYLRIEEPRDEQDPTECNVTVHYSNPNLAKDEDESEVEDNFEVDYEYHEGEYKDQQETEDEDDDDD